MPRYDRYQKLSKDMGGAVKRGDVFSVHWQADGRSFKFQKDGKWQLFDITGRSLTDTIAPEDNAQYQGGRRRRNPDRGRQFDTVYSADGKLKAISRDRNVYISSVDGKGEYAITKDGSKDKRLKFGIASWVYGEELYVREAMWFSPDSKKLAFYRFDETPVPDFYLTMSNKEVQDSLDVEAYPKAGGKNPVVGVLIYDLGSKKTTTVDTGFASDGGPGMGEYIYNIQWSPDGKELLFNRTNRKQNTMEFCAADPGTGKCRVILRESSPDSWTDNTPDMQYLEEDRPGPKRFLWKSERNGFYNFYLYDLSGKLYNAVTKNEFEVERAVKVDPAAGVLYYMARDGDTPYLLQLHRVHLDGSGDTRLTDPAYNHTVNISPDGKYFLDTWEKIDTPPTTTLRGLDGKAIEDIAKSDTTKFVELHLQKAERFTFTAADGTMVYGSLFKPSDFDSSKKYPMVFSVYGGPDSGGAGDRFALPPSITEMGFLLVNVENRGTRGRGKAFKDKMYGKCGITEIDDFASAAQELAKRPYVDASHVGIEGTSYGGYSSVMAILRHPETFQAAAASSPVTDWRNYDTIYTERYMGLPWEGDNKAGYTAGSAMTYAGNLRGRLMLYYGTADNNVHPTNTYQLVVALNKAGKSYDMQVGVDMGHTGMNFARQWEFFVDYLVNDRSAQPMDSHWNRRLRQRRAARS